MQSLLRSMTPNEQAEFKRKINPQMTAMQAHLRTMMINERMEFKRQIAPNATQTLIAALKNAKTTTNPLSRETSPHTNQTFTEPPPSRETGPHPSKSVKRLAQALKKHAKYKAKQRVHTLDFNQSFEVLAKALRSPTKTSHPDQLMKTLADTLRRHTKRKDETSTRTYAERIRQLIGPPESCKECRGEHPTHLCMKRFEKLRKPETTPLSMIDDNSTNSDTLCDFEKTENDDTEPIADLMRDMKKLSLLPTKSVAFDLPENDLDAPSHNINDASDQSDDTEEPTSQNDEVDMRLAHTAWLRKMSDNVYMSNRKSMALKAYVHAAH